MLKAGDVIENPVSGQRILLCQTPRDTQGAYTEIEYINRPYTGRAAAPAHFHPTFTEHFEILSGHACYRLGKTDGEARVGDVLVFPPGVAHLHPWSISDSELRVRQRTTPPQPDVASLEVAGDALVTLFGLARDGKVNKQGVPNLLQLAVLVRAAMPTTYLADIPIPLQYLFFGTLAAIGRRAGYQASYAKYSG